MLCVLYLTQPVTKYYGATSTLCNFVFLYFYVYAAYIELIAASYLIRINIHSPGCGSQGRRYRRSRNTHTRRTRHRSNNIKSRVTSGLTSLTV